MPHKWLKNKLISYSSDQVHTVWDPYQQNDINQVERIQMKAVRYVTSNYERQASVTEMRERLGWPTLQQRRCVARLTMFHKVENNNIAIYVPDYISKSTRSLRRQHQQAYIIIIKILIIIIIIYKVPGICYNNCCSKYEVNFAQRRPWTMWRHTSSRSSLTQSDAGTSFRYPWQKCHLRKPSKIGCGKQ